MPRDLVKRVSALIYIRVVIITLLFGYFYLFRIGYERLFYPTVFSLFIVSNI